MDTSKGVSLFSTFESFDDFLARVRGEDPTIDTGAIGGLYASGGTPLTPENVVTGNNTFSMNPLASWGWSGVVWPEGISGDGAEATPPSKISSAAPVDNTLQAVNGTLLLHSAVLGEAGRISISGDERLILALGFAEVQSARNTIYNVAITDAHSGKLINPSVRISGNTIYGELHENIDVRLTDNFAVTVDEAKLRTDRYGTFGFKENAFNSFVVHIAADSVVLQIGANEGENLSVSFGDIRASALGIGAVNVRDRESAVRAITIVDNAISKVSTKRARLGAYQNRLEHTITNLTTASANTAAAESRIRDADMAKEMVEFTKLNILSQAGNSMLGQANQLPQSVLQLLR
jgi:flagellin